ncbi:GNAT family N-acetyltransferase [Flavobacterium microcysteis]|uniref:GNAT family N-acetyltransferase n=1 Tax=Flavobacterium microcysteis TaxID=2596891 RepID=A0A501QND7_9FLAO|nr:GNAT family N-acetyltransferase [Flavobacterium microcysteis]TPD73677.1 GNAT family N-acetyltransferase [Flavobacterium microcysteis]
MIIREYTDSDKHRLLELLKLNTPEFFSPNEEKDLLYYLDNEADNYFVLVMEDKVVGCGGFNLTEDGKTAKISWDIFDPSYQGKGLGSALTQFRIEKIKENKEIKTLSVRTSQLVYPFYEKFGLQLREVVKDFWDEGFDLYRLDCDIESI